MEPTVEQAKIGWVVKIPAAGGATQELHCATEEMARRMAASLARAGRGVQRPVRPTSNGSAV